MARLPIDQLKALFVTGRVPTQQDFYNLIDSFVHLDNQVAVDTQVVNTRISTYDTALKARQPDGTINTLGDVIYALDGYADNRNINNELKWSGLPGKPTTLNVTWTEQTIVTDQNTYNPLASSGSSAGPVQRWLGSGVAGLTGSFQVIDIKCDRRWIALTSETGYFTDGIYAVKIAIGPKITL